MNLLVVSFFAGALTVLAPCVLPLLPVILGGTLGGRHSFWRPLTITLSLAISIIVFTLLLKSSTLLINVDQNIWKLVSGGIILVFGLITLFPKIWDSISFRSGFDAKSQSKLYKAGQKDGFWGNVLLGAALGPVFASCSPTYFFIIATVLPVAFFTGFLNLVAYGIGLAIVLFLISVTGQTFIRNAKWASDPHGIFKRILGLILILVGIAILTGAEKKIELYLLSKGFGNTSIEKSLLENVIDKDMPQATSSPVPTGEAVRSDTSSLPFLGKAPDIAGLTDWMNSEPVASLNDLKGKVVLIDFWTYSCVNCIRTLPFIESWHEKYAADGLVIIGVSAPEFQFEKKPENVAKAIKDFGLKYAVALDNDFHTWRAYKNQYWPAKYLIDREGNLRYKHFGEGDYEETERAIVGLLGTKEKTGAAPTQTGHAMIGTPETYLGTERRDPRQFVYDPEIKLGMNQWRLLGDWRSEDERILTSKFPASIFLNFTASEANLVIGGNAVAEVYLDGIKLDSTNGGGADIVNGQLQISEHRLYNLTKLQGNSGDHEIEVRFISGDSVGLYAWTFG